MEEKINGASPRVSTITNMQKIANWCAGGGDSVLRSTCVLRLRFGRRRKQETMMAALKSPTDKRRSKAGKANSRAAIQQTRILSVSGEPEDHKVLRRILGDSRLRISSVKTWPAAIGYLRLSPSPIVICENDVAGGSWKELLNYPAQTLIPRILIVTSRFADDHLWAEVLNLGGYDVLSKPFSEQEV